MGWFYAGLVLVAYEGAALFTGKVPTITNLMKQLPAPARRAIVGSVAAALLSHFEAEAEGLYR